MSLYQHPQEEPRYQYTPNESIEVSIALEQLLVAPKHSCALEGRLVPAPFEVVPAVVVMADQTHRQLRVVQNQMHYYSCLETELQIKK